MKKFMPVFLFIVLFAAVSAEAQHPARWGVRAGVVDGEPLVGGEMLVRLGNGFIFNPNVEFGGKLFSANADVHYQIEIMQDAALWIGAGAAFINPEGRDLDVGVNALAGLGRRYGRHILYVQGKVVGPSSYDSYASLSIGVRF